MAINKDFAGDLYKFIKVNNANFQAPVPYREIRRYVEFEAPLRYDPKFYVDYLEWIGSVKHNSLGVWAVKDPKDCILHLTEEKE